jgi:hypothetical protein
MIFTDFTRGIFHPAMMAQSSFEYVRPKGEDFRRDMLLIQYKVYFDSHGIRERGTQLTFLASAQNGLAVSIPL